MAAVPAAINLIDNHLSADGSKLQHPTYKQIANLAENDKEQLIDVELAGSGWKKDERDIRNLYNHNWPLRLLKSANWFVLLLLAIGTSICASYQLYWSDFWKTVFRERPYRLATEFAVGQWILFGLASMSMTAIFIANRIESVFWTALFSLADLCISALAVPILIVANMVFSLTALAEYRFFLPKLAHFNGTKRELASLTSTTTDDGFYYSSWTQIAFYRKREIFLHLLADPLISCFSLFGILLNIGLLVCLCKMMRRSQQWASTDYSHPGCTQFDRQYSRHYPFGMLKSIQWLFPVLALFSFLYIPLFNMNFYDHNFLTGLGLVSLVCWVQWLLYFCKVHLRNEQGGGGEEEGGQSATAVGGGNQASPPPRLAKMFLRDCLISLTISLFFLFSYFNQYNISQYQFAVYVLGIAINVGSFALLCRLLWTNPTMRQMVHLPNITIRVHINVEMAKKEEEEEQKGGGGGGKLKKEEEEKGMKTEEESNNKK